MELCKDESGDLALGKMLGESHEPQPLGGLSFVLCCILKVAPEYSTWPWWLGRLCFLRKLLDEYVGEFQLREDCPSVQIDAAGVLVQGRVPYICDNMADVYQDNVTRLMSVFKFATNAAYCSHSKVSKLAVAVLLYCTSLSAHAPTAFKHIKKVVSKLKPAQRSALQRQWMAVPSVSAGNEETIHRNQSLANSDTLSSSASHRDSAIGSLSSAVSDDETDNLPDSEIFQSLMDSLARPQSLSLTPSVSPSKELNLNWSNSAEDSPRMPPVRLALGKKCQDIIEQEEAEAVARAMAASTRNPALSRIPNLDAGDEMVIVFTQPEVRLSVKEIISYNRHLVSAVGWVPDCRAGS